MEFLDYTDQAEKFFSVLPDEWMENIVPFWKDYQANTKILVLIENNELLGGGLVFEGLSPDMLVHESAVQKYLQKKMKYLGYIWIQEEYRSQGLGKKWLLEVINHYPQQGLWLSIEEEGLKAFYQKLGFKITEVLYQNGQAEWLMQRD